MKLNDIIVRQINGLWGTSFVSENEGVPVIKTTNLTYEGKINYTDICYRDISEDKANANFLEKGDLLIEKSGGTKTHTVGYVNFFDGDNNKYVCNNFILAIRPNNEIIESKYLFYQLRYMYENGYLFDCYNKTTGIQNLKVKSYLNKQIKIVGKEQQNLIVKELDDITKIIEIKNKELIELDELVKSKFIEMFGDPLTNDKGFDITIINGVCSSIVRGPFGSSLKKEFFVAKGTNTYKVYEQKHAIQKSATIGEYYIDKERFEKLKRFECKSGDFLMSCSGTMGELYQLPIGIEQGIINQALCKFTINRKINEKYFLEAMKNIVKQIESKGSGIKNIVSVKYVKSMNILLPPIELQNQFADFVKKVDKAKDIVKKQIVDLQELLDSKMEEYFG